MRVQVLVDLDNVLGGRDLGYLRHAVANSVSRCAVLRDARHFTVSVAFNCETAIEEELNFAGLDAFAQSIAGALGGNASAALELALVPTMPQAADVALERLAREAPTAEGALGHVAALLLSADRGLADSLDDWFKGWLTADFRGVKGRVWRCPEGEKPKARRAPNRVRGGGTGAPPANLLGYTVPVDQGDATATWASSRAPDTDCSAELWRIASEVDRYPWLLSQIGITRQTVRGCRRLYAWEKGARPPLGAVSRKDGLEIRGEGPLPETVVRAGDASVGNGAARFDEACATLASKLPVALLAECRESLLVGGGEQVWLSRALDTLRQHSVSASLEVFVDMSTDRGQLVAKVRQPSGTRAPVSWWITGESHATSELRIPGCANLLPQRISGRGVVSANASGSDLRLHLRATVGAGHSVEAAGAVERWTLGSALADGSEVLILAMDSPIGKGANLSVKPIQDLPPAALKRFPATLRALPLVVPA